VLQLPPGRGGRGYAGRLVDVHVQLDGSIVAFDGPRELAVAEHRQSQSSCAPRID